MVKSQKLSSVCAAGAFPLLLHFLHMTLMILLNEATPTLILSVCLFTPHLVISEYELFRGSFVFILTFFFLFFSPSLSVDVWVVDVTQWLGFKKHPLSGIENVFSIFRDLYFLIENSSHLMISVHS